PGSRPGGARHLELAVRHARPVCREAAAGLSHGIRRDRTMARVICNMSMSLDGYVTGPNDNRENPFGDGAGTLLDWLPPGGNAEDAALIERAVAETRAVVMGRRSFDKNEGDGGWGDGGPFGDVPCFVVTHEAPEGIYSEVFTFVTDGVPSAIEQARAVAGDG